MPSKPPRRLTFTELLIRPGNEGELLDWGWLTNNVEFLATEALRPLKADLCGIRRLNVRFGYEEKAWSGHIHNGITEVCLRFDSSSVIGGDPVATQERMLSELLRGLAKLPDPHRASEALIETIRESVRATSFSTEYFLGLDVKVLTPQGPVKIAFGVRTFFDRCVVFLKIGIRKNARIVDLFDIWPSPILPLLAYEKISVEGGRLVLSVIHPRMSLQTQRFGRDYFDFAYGIRPVAMVDEKAEPPIRLLELHFDLADLGVTARSEQLVAISKLCAALSAGLNINRCEN